MNVTCSRGVKVSADTHINNCGSEVYDMIALPGGMPGAEHLRRSLVLQDLLKAQNNRNGYVAAVCASPAVVLASLGIITDETNATCYPADKFTTKINNYSKDIVVIDKNIITSRGPVSCRIEYTLHICPLIL